MAIRFSPRTDEEREEMMRQVRARVVNATPEQRRAHMARIEYATRLALAAVALKAVREVVEDRPAD